MDIVRLHGGALAETIAISARIVLGDRRSLSAPSARPVAKVGGYATGCRQRNLPLENSAGIEQVVQFAGSSCRRIPAILIDELRGFRSCVGAKGAPGSWPWQPLFPEPAL